MAHECPETVIPGDQEEDELPASAGLEHAGSCGDRRQSHDVATYAPDVVTDCCACLSSYSLPGSPTLLDTGETVHWMTGWTRRTASKDVSFLIWPRGIRGLPINILRAVHKVPWFPQPSPLQIFMGTAMLRRG